MKIGVIGNGFVGNAVGKGLGEKGDEVRAWDMNPSRSPHTLEQVVDSDILFVCVPTPTDEGRQDQHAIEDTVRIIAEMNPEAIVGMKSTVLPGTCDRLSREYGVSVISNPEFLTARTADYDFLHPTSIVLGSVLPLPLAEMKVFYEERFPGIPVLNFSSSAGAEFVKYARNTFFAVKVAYMNELAEMAGKLGMDWKDAREGILASGWVNPMHTDVPGPDGKLGFGGACLPKDSAALAAFGRANGSHFRVLEAALATSKAFRGDDD